MAACNSAAITTNSNNVTNTYTDPISDGYGYGHGGVGIIGTILIIVVILLLLGKI